MKRSEQRETIFKLLFMKPFGDDEELNDRIDLYLENLRDGLEDVDYGESVTDEDVVYMKEKLAGISEKIPEIDVVLNETSNGWKTSRMSKVDLTILRLALYEMKYDDNIPVGVAINEAVMIAKQYGGAESASFINGILGHIAKDMEKESE